MSSSWTTNLPGAIAALALVVSLITGKTFTPLRGTRPTIVSRAEMPVHYWASIALCTAFVAIWYWIA